MEIKHNLRISLSFVFLTLLIIYIVNLMGFIPDEKESVVRERISLSESLAIQFSTVIKHEKLSVAAEIMQLIVNRNPQIDSILLRKLDGEVIVKYGVFPREYHPQSEINTLSTIDHMKIPLFLDTKPWGVIEIIFQPYQSSSWFKFSDSTFIQLICIIAIIGLVLYFFLIKKLLQHLDPYKVVPQRVKIAMNAVSDGMVFIDNQEHIVLTNSAFEKKLDINANQLMGKKLSTLAWSFPDDRSSDTDNEDLNDEILPWKNTLEKGGDLNHTQLNVQASTGKQLTLIANSAPLQDNKGIIRGALISFNDVTEIEKINHELENMSRFLQHEMINALINASGTLSALENSEQISDNDKKIVNRTQQFHLVIRKILESVKEAKNIESSFSIENAKPVNLENILADIVGNYSNINTGNEYIFKSENNDSIVFAHEERIIQMIDKLTTNAIEHSSPDSVILYTCKKENGNAVITVSNKGDQLPENKQKIFELFASFRTTENKNENQGIGLYVVKLIAESYDGSVEARDREDETGAEFIIKLPLTQ